MVATRAKLWWCAVVLVVVQAVGCSDTSSGVSVEGRATYRGEPLTNSSLTFFPTSGRPVSVAAVGPDGEYSVELPPGDYDVAVTVGLALPAGWKEGDPIPPQRFVLPDQYTTRAKTTLTAAVAPDQDEPINFELQ